MFFPFLIFFQETQEIPIMPLLKRPRPAFSLCNCVSGMKMIVLGGKSISSKRSHMRVSSAGLGFWVPPKLRQDARKVFWKSGLEKRKTNKISTHKLCVLFSLGVLGRRAVQRPL
jgi:hypothetical protein